MPLSAPALHAGLRLDAAVLESLPARIAEAAHRRTVSFAEELALPPGQIRIPLTTVSLAGGFDATISVRLAGMPEQRIPLLVDSGNSTLILPRWEDIADRADYQVLGEVHEPWGCPAYVVRGPILLDGLGGAFTIDDCVFYACFADNDQGVRTANFGAGCLSPWATSGWNTPLGPGLVMTAPLAGAAPYRYALFDYAAADEIFADDLTLRVAASSWLTLTKTEPAGFTMFPIRRDLAWMSIAAKSLAIAGRATAWPGNGTMPPLAVIDTGGTCAFLSDPGSLVCTTAWPHLTANPDWTGGSVACESVADAITIEIGDAAGSFVYTIDPAHLTAGTRGMTLVMCQQNEYMRGMPGMNVGGITALINLILIDYGAARVGFRAK